MRHMSNLLDIANIYLPDYSVSYSGRMVAKLAKISPQSASTYLNHGVNQGIFKFITKGRNKEYSLNLLDIRARYFISISECYSAFNGLKDKELRVLIKEISPYAETIILFGSFASGTQDKDSDIDLVILGKSRKKEIDRIKKHFPREVNIEYINYSDFKKTLMQKNALALEILKNHVIFGNVNKVVDMFIHYYMR